MTLKQKQERLKELLKLKEKNDKAWKVLEDELRISSQILTFQRTKDIKKFITEMQKLIFIDRVKA